MKKRARNILANFFFFSKENNWKLLVPLIIENFTFYFHRTH